MSCDLSKPVFLAAQEITSFKETPDGFFLESFLISDKLNLNDWQVTAEANQKDGHTFIGKPDIIFINNGKRDHTTGPTLEESLKIQEPFRKGTILKVMGTELGTKLHTVSKITDPKTIELIKKKEIRFVSPAVFPKSLEDIEIIKTGPNTHIHKLHRYIGLHRAFVDEPAYGGEATLGQTCQGDGSDCLQKLEQYKAGIGDDNIAPLQQKKIVSIKKCSVTGNTIVEYEESSNILDNQDNIIMPDLEKENKELKSKLAETEEKLQANIEETKKKDTEAAKKATDEKEKLDAKKSADEKEKENAEEAKKADDEKKEKDMTARIASEISEKLPLVEKYIAAQAKVGSLEDKQIQELRTKMLAASLAEVKSQWDAIEPFAASLPDIPQESKIGYNPTDYNANVGDNSISTMTQEELIKEAGLN